MALLKSAFASLFSRWNEFWFAEISAYPIAAYRILLGVYLLIYLGASAPNVALFFSNEGVYSPFLIPDIAPPVWLAWILYSLTMLLTLAFTAGYKSKFTTPALLLMFLYHFFLNIAVKACSYERLLLMSLVLMCFGEIDAAWSHTAMCKPKEDGEAKVSAWLTRLLAFHLAYFYALTGVFKLLSPGWHSGEIIKGVMSGVWASNASFWLLSWKPAPEIFNLMAYSVVLFELTCPFFFFVRRLDLNISVGESVFAIKIPNVQFWFFLCGLMFHIGIWVFMQIPQFMICPIGYVLFLQGEQVRELFQFSWRRLRWLF
ncbi:MAG: hypothetical protein K2X81_09965 [Candidatus Obscuribacterales bacterium]|nr:hypothetical protein [Candidatus Obscuribacterales bacterium]